MKSWNEIRTHWVNGERNEAKDALYQLNTRSTLRVVEAAICAFYKSLPNGTPQSGDLADLLQIIRSYGKLPDQYNRE